MFESYLGLLKKKVHSGRLPLKQLVCRLGERDGDESDKPRPAEVPVNIPSIKPPNNVYILPDGKAVEALSEVLVNGKTLYQCRKFRSHVSLFDSPIDSREISCFVVDDDTSIVQLEPNMLIRKGFKIELNNKIVVMGMMHNPMEEPV